MGRDRKDQETGEPSVVRERRPWSTPELHTADAALGANSVQTRVEAGSAAGVPS